MSIYGKHPSKSSLNQWAYYNETWYVASVTQARYIVCSNDKPRLTLSCLTAMSNIATLAFIWENVIMMDSLENHSTICNQVLYVNANKYNMKKKTERKTKQ